MSNSACLLLSPWLDAVLILKVTRYLKTEAVEKTQTGLDRAHTVQYLDQCERRTV